MPLSASLETEKLENGTGHNRLEMPRETIISDKKENPAKKMLAKKHLFLNYKGGTGKTTISAAYGYYLASIGKKVLLVDLDAQAHLTACFNKESINYNRSLYGVIVNDDKLSDIIVPTSLPNLKLIPSSISLSALELPLFKMPLREYRLRKVLSIVDKEYDYVIIDSAPNIGLLSLNAILAADDIMIPLLADFLSFHGLKILLETLASIERDFNFYVGNIHIFLNRYNPDYQVCRDCGESVNKFYPEYALKTVVRESRELMDASSHGKSIFELSPDSAAAEDIRSLVLEVNGFDK